MLFGRAKWISRENASQVSWTRPAALVAEAPSVPDRPRCRRDKPTRLAPIERFSWIDRFDVHSVPIAGNARALRRSHCNTVAGIESRPGRDQLDALGASAEMSPHHIDVALKTAGGEHNGVSIERPVVASLVRTLIPLIYRSPSSSAFASTFVANLYPCSFCRLGNFLDDSPAAAGRLDPRPAGAEIIDRHSELDPVRLQPANGLRPHVRKRSIIASIGQSARQLPNFVFEPGRDPVGRLQAAYKTDSSVCCRRLRLRAISPARVTSIVRPRSRACSAADSAAARPAAPCPTTTSFSTTRRHLRGSRPAD